MSKDSLDLKPLNKRQKERKGNTEKKTLPVVGGALQWGGPKMSFKENIPDKPNPNKVESQERHPYGLYFEQSEDIPYNSDNPYHMDPDDPKFGTARAK